MSEGIYRFSPPELSVLKAMWLFLTQSTVSHLWKFLPWRIVERVLFCVFVFSSSLVSSALQEISNLDFCLKYTFSSSSQQIWSLLSFMDVNWRWWNFMHNGGHQTRMHIIWPVDHLKEASWPGSKFFVATLAGPLGGFFEYRMTGVDENSPAQYRLNETKRNAVRLPKNRHTSSILHDGRTDSSNNFMLTKDLKVFYCYHLP